MDHRHILREKLMESVRSVLPIASIVALLCLFFIPVDTGLFLSFALGTGLIIVGMTFFTIGSDLSMSQIGEHIGSRMTASRNILLIIVLSLILGIAVTVAEPDLQVLAQNAPHIDTTVLILTVSIGVGIFLAVSMLRILLGIPLKWLLVGFYGLIFLLSALSDKNFLSVSFDAGGVTTGPMTVPFIMALGVGVASIRSDKHAKSDGFGLVALCSIGPILAVLILGFLYPADTMVASQQALSSYAHSTQVGLAYLTKLPSELKEVSLALLPIVGFFLLFQVFALRLQKQALRRILIGLVYTYLGLVLFLLGVNVGFSSLGLVLGESLILSDFRWMLIPLSMAMGWFIIQAEPAVHVLNKQVSTLSAGAISEKTMGLTLSIAISLAMGLAMIRVLTGISILYFMLPGYLIAIILAFFVPKTFTAIAFDAGGVASGPMTATFMLPFAMGACKALGGNIVTDAFGLVALVAMMPLITVQVMGAISTFSHRQKAPKTAQKPERFADNEIIELWEV